MKSEFRGFKREAFSFLRDLSANNEREWFQANQRVYQEFVVQPAQQFVQELGQRLSKSLPQLQFDPRADGRGSIFRLHRDVRFGPDKSPYKTNLGMIFWLEIGEKKTASPNLYVGLYPKGVLVSAGLSTFPPSVAARYRERVVSPKSGPALRRLLKNLETKGYQLDAPTRKRVPRGFAADHPSADLLLRDGCRASTPMLKSSSACAPSFLDESYRISKDLIPLVRWLGNDSR